MARWHSPPPPRIQRAMRGVGLALLLSACASGDTLFSGTVRPAAGTCDPPSQATLTIRNGAVLFSPTSGVLTLDGTRAADGAIEATTTRPGPAHTPVTFRLTARQAANRIEGTFTTPRCRYRVELSAGE